MKHKTHNSAPKPPQASVKQDDKILIILKALLEEVRRQNKMIGNLERVWTARRGTPPHSAPDSLKLNIVFNQYPQFEADFEKLLSCSYISATPQGLVWNKSKQSLAEYFGRQKHSGKCRKWQDIERLFNVKALTNSLSRNGSSFKRYSKDYEELIKLLDAPVAQ